MSKRKVISLLNPEKNHPLYYPDYFKRNKRIRVKWKPHLYQEDYVNPIQALNIMDPEWIEYINTKKKKQKQQKQQIVKSVNVKIGNNLYTTQCKYCNQSFPSGREFVQHALNDHLSKRYTTIIKGKLYQCNQCKIKLNNEYQLLEHYSICK
jgi:hypothetical protein